MGMVATVIAGLMEIVGIGLVGHALYKSGHSGAEIYSSVLQQGAGPIRDFELQLDPGMNPLRVSFSARVDRSRTRGSSMSLHYNYYVTITEGGKRVAQKSLGFRLEPDQDASGRRKTMVGEVVPGYFDWNEVASAGRYRFATAWQGGDSREVLRGIGVEVRRNVEDVVMKKLWWGVGLILVGGLIQFMFGVPLSGSRPD